MDPSDGDMTVSEDVGSGISRRDAIKKGAIVGGAVVWATPVIQAIGITPAGAQIPSPTTLPGACPGCPTCTANATGLSALGINLATADGTGGPDCECVVDANVNAGTIGAADAEVICARADDATCTASSYVAGLVVRLGSSLGNDVFLEASALGSCVSCGTGTSYVLDLELVVRSLLGIVVSRTPITLTAVAGTSCTTGVNGVTGFPALEIRANEQICGTNGLTVNALRVTLLGSFNVIAGQSRAGAGGCACTPCSPNPPCTAPRSQLCTATP